MNYQALYRKYRPQIFDDVKGQEIIVRTLRNQIRSGRISHAYLFCGSRGTGKTTCAKILAKAINCEHPVDGNPCTECASCRAIQAGNSMNVVEMDAASQRGIENFRQIIAEIAYPPTDSKYKVYIIDEVHMLTPEAFNAFLKTLEEPPEYAVFILATTDPQKLLATVLSRCQRYDFRRIPSKIIGQRLKEVFDAEGVEAEEDAISAIARRAEGGLRDALSIADQCISFFPGEKLTSRHLLDALGTAGTQVYRSMLRSALNGDASSMIRQFDDMLMDGRDVRQIVSDLTWYLRDLLIFKASGGSSETDDMVEEDRAELLEDAELIDEQQLMYYIEVLSDLTNALRNSAGRRVLTEIALINLCRPQGDTEHSGALAARVALIEDRLENGYVRASDDASAGAYEGNADPVKNRDGRVPMARDEGGVKGDAGSLAGTGGSDAELPRAVAPELFQKIASQWKQTMSSLQNRGRGEVLASCCKVSFSPDEPETLYIAMADNWYRSFASDKKLAEEIGKAIGAKYGTRPEIRFVNTAESKAKGLSAVSARVEELQQEGINFPIDVEE